MSGRITAKELERLIADDSTPDDVLAPYLIVDDTQSGPLSVRLAVDSEKIDGPVMRGMFDPLLKILNEREHRRRLAAYKERIAAGWKGPRLLAEGDSWFLYPVLLKDVVDNLRNEYAVYSLAAAGDTLDNMAKGFDEIEKLIAEHKFDAFLLSAGGNDLAGEPLKRYLEHLKTPAKSPNAYLGKGLEQFLGSVRDTYDALFRRLTTRFPDLHILCHGYDWALPRPQGRWLWPPLSAIEVPQPLQAAVIKVLIDRFYGTLQEVAAKYPNRVHVIDCRGSIGAEPEWWDELHPRNSGYTRVADCFRKKLHGLLAPKLRSAGEPVVAESGGIKLAWRSVKDRSGAREWHKSLPAGSSVTIGRSGEREIVLDDDRVSRLHTRIEVARDGVVRVHDEASTNGTLVGGKAIKSAVWAPNQEMKVGVYVFSYQPVPLAERPAIPLSRGAPEDMPRAEAVVAAAEPAPVASSIAEPAAEPSRRLDIELVHGNLVDIPAAAYVVGIFEHVSPLASRGPASAIDWATKGDMSSLVQSGLFGCRLGEISLLPTPQQELLTEIIAFAGLGSLTNFTSRALEAVGENLAKVLLAGRISGCATVPIGTNTGCTTGEFVRAFVPGLLRGMGGSRSPDDFRKLIICEMDEGRYLELVAEVEALNASGVAKGLGFALNVTKETVGPRTRGETPPPPPVNIRHVIVNALSDTSYQFYTLPSLGAGLPCFEMEVDPERRQKLAQKTAGMSTSFDAELGNELARLYVPGEIQKALASCICDLATHLVVVHDRASSSIPWEALYFGDKCAALESGVTRKCRVTSSRPAGAPLPAGSVLKMLVVYPGYGGSGLKSLPGAVEEGRMLTELFQANNGDVTVLSGAEATKTALLGALDEGNYAILHYAGHAMFDERRPERSGLLMDKGEVVSSADLTRLAAVPKLVFFNACESGRLRGGGGTSAPLDETTLGTNVTLAEALFSIGVGNFVGTYWPVEDTAAKQFAHTFYEGLLKGGQMSAGLRAARLAVREGNRDGERHWANYLHFGDPIDRIREVGG